jgi:hypothetical protein
MFDLCFITNEDKVNISIELNNVWENTFTTERDEDILKILNEAVKMTTKYDRSMNILQDQEQQGSFDFGYVCR